jgi:hypothetical protein
MAASDDRQRASGKFTIVPAPGPAYRASKEEQAAISEIRRVSERAKTRIARSGRATKPR